MRLRTLGELSVEGASYRREKPLLLLAYLCVEGAQPRRRLASLFWPEAANPMNSLAQHLIRLRPLAGAVREDGSRVEAHIECDVGLLRSHNRAGRHAEAAALYGGPFLDGLGVALGPDLEEWLFETREALGREVRAAHLTLAERRLALGDRAGAAAGAERAHAPAGAPPPDGEDLRRLFALLQAGDHPLAGAVRREAEELGVPLRSAPALPPAPVLIGRGDERAALEALRPGQLAWVSGPPGIGKSALLAALAAGGGWRVLPGRAGLPLATLEPLAPRLTGSADVLSALSDGRLRVAVDGWEDADEATRTALALAARQRPGAVLVVAARAPPVLPADLHLALGPLTAADLAPHPGAFEATAGAPALLAAFLRGAPPHQTLDAHLSALAPPAREVYLTLALQPTPDLAATRAALGLAAADFTRTLDLLIREGLCLPRGEVRTPGPAQALAAASSAQTALRQLHLARAHREGSGWTHWHAARTLWEDGDHPAAARAAHAHASEEMKRGYPAQAAATLEGAPQTEEVRLLRGWALMKLEQYADVLTLISDIDQVPGVAVLRSASLSRLGRLEEARTLALRVPRDMTADHAHAESVLGHIAQQQDNYLMARAHYQASATLWHLHDEHEWVAVASALATVRSTLGEPPDVVFQDVLAAVNHLPSAACLIYPNYAHALQQAGQPAQAAQAAQLALTSARGVGNTLAEISALNTLGVCAHLSGATADAVVHYELALALCHQCANFRALGMISANLAELTGDSIAFANTLKLLRDSGQQAYAEMIECNIARREFASAVQMHAGQVPFSS